MADNHNGKQMEATRIELFIALSYLLDRCNSKNTPSKTIELTKYADERYNTYIDRRRANSIFATLLSLTNKYPRVLPYKIIQIEGKPRYYIEKNLFNKKDIERLAKAAYADVNVSDSAGYRLVNSIIDKLCNQDDKDKTKERVFKQRVVKRTKHISRRSMDKLTLFEELRDNGKRFYFRLTKTPSMINYSNRDVITRFRKHRQAYRENKKDYMPGIVYEINAVDKKHDICIYMPDQHGAIIVNLEYVELDYDFEPVEQIEPTDFVLRGSKINDIDKWLDTYYKGGTGLQVPVTFKFFAGFNNENIEEYSGSFESSFGIPMEYELVDRSVTYDDYEGVKHTLVVKDAIVKVTCNFRAFKRWYWEASKAYRNVVVIEPKVYNNRLIGDITKRFQQRLKTYGIDTTNKTL